MQILPTGFPLQFDIEGPLTAANSSVVLGARPTTSGYDLRLTAQLSSVVLLPSVAPPMFSSCVLSCLETLTANTTDTTISTLTFDQVARQLILNGPAHPNEFQQVLRGLVYLNTAPDINLDSITLEVS